MAIHKTSPVGLSSCGAFFVVFQHPIVYCVSVGGLSRRLEDPKVNEYKQLDEESTGHGRYQVLPVIHLRGADVEDLLADTGDE